MKPDPKHLVLTSLLVLSACADSGGAPLGTAILERPPQIAASCAVTSPMAQIGGVTWYLDALVGSGGMAWLAHGGEVPAVVPVDASGALGTPLELGEQTYGASWMALAPLSGGRVGVAWAHTGVDALSSLRMAIIGADGAYDVEPTSVPGTEAAYVASPSLAEAVGGGIGLLFGSADSNGAGRLRLVTFDDAGALLTGPTDIATAATGYGYFAANLVASGDGYAASWVEGYEATSLKLARFSASGVLRGAPLGVSSGRAGWTLQMGSSLLVSGGVTWVAWVEERFEGSDFGDSAGRAELWVSALGPTDTEVKPARMAVAVKDRIRTNPRLTTHAGAVGLAWSEGSYIYICGGCITDYDVNFVLLDRDALGEVVPASEVVTLLHDKNGLAARGFASFGDALLVGASLDFHALSYPALGTITCTAP